MLPKDFTKSISSLNEAELEEMYVRFLRDSDADDVVKFARHLYTNKDLTNEELKKIQNQEKVEFTSFIDLKDEDEEDENGASHSPEDTDKKPAKEVFTILESIDEGAMGEILIAKDNELGRTVAYKKIHQRLTDRPDFMRRFFMEAQITAQLQHPNIVPIYRLRVSDKGVGYAMKLIQGETLKALIEKAKSQLNKKNKTDEHHSLLALLDHFLKVCDALHYSHRKGVVHRDLKPLNIMVGPYNEVYVMDWGIAKLVDVDSETFSDKTKRVGTDSTENDDSESTSAGQLLGTPVYMSPEQANGNNDELDHRSDIFSLGLILFELITLKRALSGKGQQEILARARTASLNPPVPYSRKLSVPNQLIAIVNKATEIDPDDRYETAEQFSDDIRRYLRGEAVSARRDSIREKVIRWMNNHRGAALNIVAYSVLASVFIVSWSLYKQQQSDISSQLQTQKISQFISNVSTQSQIIDTQFLKFESILQGVSSVATNLLEQNNPDPGKYYDHKDLADPSRAPPDYTHSSVNGFPISIGWHAYKLAPGVEYKEVEKLVRVINPLRHTFKRMILKSHTKVIAPKDNKTAARVIRDEGLPLVWTYVGLKEGIFAEYPGHTGYPPEFDPRKRPWYVSTMEREGACWMPPYIDVGGRGVLLPCTSKLFNNKGEFLGVAAVEMTLEYIRHQLMSISNMKGIKNTYLLNERGAIIVDSSQNSKSFERGTLVNSIDDLEIFPNKYIVDQINSQEKSGYINFSGNGRKEVIAYNRLNSIGWYYLAIADAEKVGRVESLPSH
jgi:eukaryotic-like serine/threonine-protein kinase